MPANTHTMLFEHYAADDIEGLIKKAALHAPSGAEHVAKMLAIQLEDATELCGIIEARARNAKCHDAKYALPDDLRFATQADVAAWRAKRLRCKTLIEVGAGIGMQTIAFARECRKVIAIEPDKRKLAYAMANARHADLDNIHFVQGNAFDVLEEVTKLSHPAADIIFLDPQRPPGEDVRDLHANFSPPLFEFVEKYGALTQAIAVELPPHTVTIDMEGEREYMSVDGQLRRLTLYRGPLAKAARSAVAVPSNAHIQGDPLPLPSPGKTGRFLYECDEAIVRAGLVPFIAKDCVLIAKDKVVLLSSNDRVISPFFRNSFDILSVCDPKQPVIRAHLQSAGAKQVVLRQSVPAEQYWQERRKYEAGLTGAIPVHLFVLPDIAIIAKKQRQG
jgi:hypothetical protein